MSRLVVFTILLFLQACSSMPELSSADVEQKIEPQSRVISTEGQAQIVMGAKILARKQAFQTAIRKVAQLAGSSYSKEALLGSTKVVDEWIENDIYHLQLVAVLSDGQSCNSPYRKRIVATAFPSVQSGQISGNETQDLYSGIPREMMNILMESGHFIGRNETHTVLYSRPDMAPEIFSQNAYQDSVLVQMARQHGAQFILSGVIRDFEVESTEYIRGAGIFAQVKSAMRDFVARRGITIDVYVHDGLTGSLLFQHRYTDTVIGDVWIPGGYTVGSERFKATPAGHKVSGIITNASEDIAHLFACYPFSSRVLKVENNRIYFAAGSQDKLKKGDSLVVYALDGQSEIQEQRMVGVIVIENVQANFSVGYMELTSDARKIKAGDLVKSW